MKITIDRKVLTDILTRVQSITSARTNLIITSTVKIASKNKGIEISATNLITDYQKYIDPFFQKEMVVEGEGCFVVDAKRLLEVVRLFPTTTITIETDDDRECGIKISNEKIKYKIAGFPHDDFPLIPVPDDAAFYDISAPTLKGMICRAVAINPYKDDIRAHIAGVSFEFSKEKIILVSTDTARLSMSVSEKLQAEDVKPFSVLVPKQSLTALNKFLLTGDARVACKDNSLVVVMENETFLIQLLEGEFPEYENVVATPDCEPITIHRESFIRALRRMSIITDDTVKAVIFRFCNNNIGIRSEDIEIGNSKEDFPIKYEGADITVGFNPKLLIEMLSSLSFSTVEMFIKDKESALFIECKEQDYLCIIMPVNIGE